MFILVVVAGMERLQRFMWRWNETTTEDLPVRYRLSRTARGESGHADREKAYKAEQTTVFFQETSPCYGPSCAAWTEWCEWSGCSVKCGPGQRTRTRACHASDGTDSRDCLGQSIVGPILFRAPCHLRSDTAEKGMSRKWAALSARNALTN